jgi:hypothetical protein
VDVLECSKLLFSGQFASRLRHNFAYFCVDARDPINQLIKLLLLDFFHLITIKELQNPRGKLVRLSHFYFGLFFFCILTVHVAQSNQIVNLFVVFLFFSWMFDVIEVLCVTLARVDVVQKFVGL